jgi:hypothetical protein
MKHTITRLFDTRAEAETAVRELEAAGIPHDDISLIAPKGAAGETRTFADNDGRASEAAEGAGKGAAAGGAIGAGAGLLAGLGLLAIPGLGPVVAAGWLASLATGAAVGAAAGGATGGILGALKDAGVPDDEANVYAEGVRRGATLVSVRTDQADTASIDAILTRARGIDAATRGAAYRQEGWTRFDPEAGPYAG